jgi:hypothetical protein
MATEFLFTSESVSEGHPDKVADQVSDGVLDTILAEDPHARVACETLVSTGLVVVSGEITTKAHPNYLGRGRLGSPRTHRVQEELRSSPCRPRSRSSSNVEGDAPTLYLGNLSSTSATSRWMPAARQPMPVRLGSAPLAGSTIRKRPLPTAFRRPQKRWTPCAAWPTR